MIEIIAGRTIEEWARRMNMQLWYLEKQLTHFFNKGYEEARDNKFQENAYQEPFRTRYYQGCNEYYLKITINYLRKNNGI